MKAAVYYETGAPEVLKYEDVPDPVCFPSGIVIRVEAIAVEGGDVLNRFHGEMPAKPHIVGYQAAGEVIEVGADVKTFRVGDKVATVGPFGSHAEKRLVHERTAWKVPRDYDIRKAAAIPVTFGTADECLFEFARLKRDETVLIQAGASGVGVAAIQLARRAGARLILATASSDERLERLKPLGVDHGINYRRDDVVNEVIRATGGQGCDVVIDPVGGAALQSSILSLAYRGRCCTVGQAGREPMNIDVSTMMAGNRSLIGVFLGAEIIMDRVHNKIQRLIEVAARGELRVIIDKTFPLSEAAEAHRYIESRQAVGRVVLIP